MGLGGDDDGNGGDCGGTGRADGYVWMAHMARQSQMGQRLGLEWLGARTAWTGQGGEIGDGCGERRRRLGCGTTLRLGRLGDVAGELRNLCSRSIRRHLPTVRHPTKALQAVEYILLVPPNECVPQD